MKKLILLDADVIIDLHILNLFDMNDEASEWRRKFGRLSPARRKEFLQVLAALNWSRNKQQGIGEHRSFRSLLEHYYPDGKVTECV